MSKKKRIKLKDFQVESFKTELGNKAGNGALADNIFTTFVTKAAHCYMETIYECKLKSSRLFCTRNEDCPF